jgi:hypothetical protein
VLNTLHPSLTVIVISSGHLILGRTKKTGALAAVASFKPKTDLKAQARDFGSFLQRFGIYKDEELYLLTPRDLLRAGYQFQEVQNSKGLWAKWMEFNSRLPRIALLTRDLATPIDGFPIHLAPSLMITPASSEADSDSETDSSSSASAELTSDSTATSESGDDQGGMGTVATALAQLTMGSLKEMPNIRKEMFPSPPGITNQNHSPSSWTTTNEGP